MNMSKEKLAKWLHELGEYRKAEAVEREEFNGYDWKTASEFVDETNEIIQASRELSEEKEDEEGNPEEPAEADRSAEECDAKPMTLDEAIQHCKDIVEKAGDCKCSKQHAQLAEWLEELKDVKTRHAYLAADFENYKRRTASAEADAKRKGRQDAVFHFLDVHDNIERLCRVAEKCEDVSDGVKSLKEGCELIKKKVEQTLSDLGASKIEVRHGDKLDVSTMEAVATKHEEGKQADQVLCEVRSGWTCDGKVLRYADVVVTC